MLRISLDASRETSDRSSSLGRSKAEELFVFQDDLEFEMPDSNADLPVRSSCPVRQDS